MSVESLGRMIRELRASRAWSQATLAEQSGVSAAAISLIESGKRQPMADTVEKLAVALGVSISELVAAPRPHRAEASFMLEELEGTYYESAAQYIEYLLRRQRADTVLRIFEPTKPKDEPPKPPVRRRRRLPVVEEPENPATVTDAKDATSGEAEIRQGDTVDITLRRWGGVFGRARYVLAYLATLTNRREGIILA